MHFDNDMLVSALSPQAKALQRILLDAGLSVRMDVKEWNGGALHLHLLAAPQDARHETRASTLLASARNGLVLSGVNFGVDFERLWSDADGFIAACASPVHPTLLISHEAESTNNVPWALELAAELAIVMISAPPPRDTVLHVAVPASLSARRPHVADSGHAARALFSAGHVAVSPLRHLADTVVFGPEQESWAIAALHLLAPRLGGAQSPCDCCIGSRLSVFQSNYSERTYQ